jgi:hypothetical protein
MNPLRPVAFHVGALVLGGLCAGFVWSQEKTPISLRETNVVVWTGRPADVQRITHENKSRKVTLEAKTDDWLHWFLGTAQPLPLPSPTRSFPSVTVANKLAEAFAPLKATRSLGKIDSARAAEYGLDKQDVSLTIVIRGKEQKLWVGAPAPGATDQYVLDAATNQAYSIKIDPFHDLDGGEAKMMEHDQHDFRELDIVSAKIIAGDKTRAGLWGGPEGKKFWADPSDREKADETLGNWMQKVDRLRPNEYVQKPPDNAKVVVRIEYTGSTKRKGYFELVKAPAADGGDKPDYWLTTEYMHLYGKLVPAYAEQVEQDVGSVVK